MDLPTFFSELIPYLSNRGYQQMAISHELRKVECDIEFWLNGIQVVHDHPVPVRQACLCSYAQALLAQSIGTQLPALLLGKLFRVAPFKFTD
ncbi:hypothetical protein D3C77_460250 [compost metagenome]